MFDRVDRVLVATWVVICIAVVTALCLAITQQYQLLLWLLVGIVVLSFVMALAAVAVTVLRTIRDTWRTRRKPRKIGPWAGGPFRKVR